jgi:hypothetical protein
MKFKIISIKKARVEVLHGLARVDGWTLLLLPPPGLARLAWVCCGPDGAAGGRGPERPRDTRTERPCYRWVRAADARDSELLQVSRRGMCRILFWLTVDLSLPEAGRVTVRGRPKVWMRLNPKRVTLFWEWPSRRFKQSSINRARASARSPTFNHISCIVF